MVASGAGIRALLARLVIILCRQRRHKAIGEEIRVRAISPPHRLAWRMAQSHASASRFP